MALYKSYTSDSVLWGIWKIEETQDELYSCLPHPESIRRKVEELKTECRQTERLAVRVLLYKILKEQKEILYYPSGRPYLPEGSWNMSISHTGGYAALLLSRTKEAGIDIERYGERISRVVSRFVREDELLVPYKGTDRWAMLLHWSAKETLFKCMDRKGIDFKEHFRIFPFVPEKEGCFPAQEYFTKAHKKYTVHYLLDSEFVLTWCIAS